MVFPNVPTIAETGLPGFEFTPWFGIIAPAGTPRPIINRLNQHIARALENPDVKTRLTSQGAQPLITKPADFDALIKSEVAKLGKLLKASGVGG